MPTAERTVLAALADATTRFLNAELDSLGDLIDARDQAREVLGDDATAPVCNCDGEVIGFHSASCRTVTSTSCDQGAEPATSTDRGPLCDDCRLDTENPEVGDYSQVLPGTAPAPTSTPSNESGGAS